ncbi:MAG TPA: PspC domain-containing protein [Methylomirabilota bacterium]|nr:PspC domain-containing protein [Methylomirabilota bacterium]
MNGQRLYRSSDRIIGGVCAGLAEGFHVDALWVRVAFLILIFIQGIGVFLYIVLWLVMPERVEGGGHRSGFDAMTADIRRIWGELQHPTAGKSQAGASAPASLGVFQNQSLVFGLILVVIGLVLLGGNVGIINWSVVWPAALITLGIVVLVRNLEKRP